MILITQGDFLERTTIDLAQELRDSNVATSEQADSMLIRWEKFVYKMASKMGCPIRDERLNENQIDSIKDAVCNYGAFCLVNGDYETLGNKVGNPVPNIIDTLKQYGVIHSNFKGR